MSKRYIPGSGDYVLRDGTTMAAGSYLLQTDGSEIWIHHPNCAGDSPGFTNLAEVLDWAYRHNRNCDAPEPTVP